MATWVSVHRFAQLPQTHIKGGGTSPKDCQLTIENQSYHKGIEFRYKSATTSGTYDFSSKNIQLVVIGTIKLHFSTAAGSTNANTAAVEVMTLDSAGKVGIVQLVLQAIKCIP